jgi:hypothetical protein
MNGAFLFTLILASAPQFTANPSAIQQQIAQDGAARVLSRIYANKAIWVEVLRDIASGEEDWLDVANRLYPASDAGSREQLAQALGEALEHQPDKVLRVSVPIFGFAVCAGPDVDDARYDSFDLSMAAIHNREVALLRVDGADLRKRRDSCLAELEAARDHVGAFYGVRRASLEIARTALTRSHADVSWHPVMTVDINCDGLEDRVFTARDHDRFYVAVVLAPLDRMSRVSEAAFRLRGQSEDALCGSPLMIERERLDYDPREDGEGMPEGFERSSTCLGLRLVSGECDSFHLFWNRERNQLSWWRL